LKKFLFSLPSCAAILLLLTLISCQKNEEIGFEVQPPEDKIIVGFNDQGGIVAYTVREDSVRTDETLLNLLGSYFDPIFGTSAAGYYVQFRLSNSNVAFGTNAVVDSIVLALAYSGGYYGDITTVQSADVFEVEETFLIDSSYYSFDRLNCSSTDLYTNSFLPKPNDSVHIGTNVYAPHLRLRLDNSLAQKFITASGTSDLANDPNFLLFFKGLYIVADPAYVNGAMLYFNLLSSASKLTLYYHNDEHDSLSYDFLINENSARVNTFDHFGYSGANHDFQMQIAGDTALGEQNLFLQGMCGVKTFLRFPDLKPLLNDGNVVVNKAELIITPNASMLNTYAQPDRLTLSKINADGSLSFLPDQYYGTDYFGGSYNSTTGEYRFNIATYIQYLIRFDEYAGQGLYLALAGSAINGSRLAINGPGKESSNLRLEISYTKLN